MAQDPEYSITDNFRSARTSNEKRMLLLHQLAFQTRRKIGLKVSAAART